MIERKKKHVIKVSNVLWIMDWKRCIKIDYGYILLGILRNRSKMCLNAVNAS